MAKIEDIKSLQELNVHFTPDIAFQFNDFVLCPRQNLLTKGDNIIKLNQKSIQCLILLVVNANRVVLKDIFFEQIWHGCFVGEGVLNVNISNLRKILGKDSIVTYHYRGYKFNQTVKIVKSPTYCSTNIVTSSKEEFSSQTNLSFWKQLKIFFDKFKNKRNKEFNGNQVV